jgi:hypothetical protein
LGYAASRRSFYKKYSKCKLYKQDPLIDQGKMLNGWVFFWIGLKTLIYSTLVLSWGGVKFQVVQNIIDKEQAV